MKISMNRKQSGFTLIELAIVLVIVGVLIGSFIGTLGARIDTTRRAETAEDLDRIKTALLGYAYSTGAGSHYLPCPCTANCDTNGGLNPGQENRGGGGACTAVTAVGYLPWGTLGLKPGDSWNTLYSYWVDPDFSDSATAFVLADTGSGQVRTRSPNGANTPLVAGNVVAVVYSHGKNTYGGLSVAGDALPAIPAANVDEINNTDNNSEFVSRIPTGPDATTAGGEFDDIVLWITDYEIKARMIDAGMLALP